MADQEILILKNQLEKIDYKEFDLDSWKIFTINILERIFGVSSHKIDQIKELKYDFSSWSLRDTSGSAGSIKKRAKVILESAINELENFGLPKQEKESKENVHDDILNIIADELKGSQFKRLKELLKNVNSEEKRKELKGLLNEIGNDTVEALLLKILMKIQ
jgi:hypothetical protein